MAYTLHIRNEDLTSAVLTSADIIARLDMTVPRQAAYIALVQDLERKGCKYSNQDFDTLSGAYRAIGKVEVADYERAFVAHWAPLARAAH